MHSTIASIIKSGIFPPVILMFGEEEFLLDQDYQKLKKALLKNEANKYDMEIMDGEKQSATAIVSTASSFPFASELRIITVKNFDKLFPAQATAKTLEKSPFNKYFQSPQPSTVLILQSDKNKLNGLQKALQSGKTRKVDTIKKSLKFPYNVLIENHAWAEYPKVWDNELPRYTTQLAKEIGVELEPQAMELILMQTNPSLRDIYAELDKLKLFAGTGKKITADDVHNITGTSRSYNVFELQKAIGRRNTKQCLLILNRMLSESRQEILIVTMLTRYFMALWKLPEAKSQFHDNYKQASAIGISPFFIQEYSAAYSKYGLPKIEAALQYLAETDTLLKSTSHTAISLLQNMIINITTN